MATVAHRLTLALAALLAWALSRSTLTARQRAVAWTLTTLAVINLTRPALRPWPVLDLAAFLAWYVATAAGVAAVLRGTTAKWWWTMAVPATLAVSFGVLRFGVGRPTVTVVFAASLAAELVAVTLYLRRREVPGQAETAALLLAASQLADVVGPWLVGQPVRDWYAGLWPAVVTWCAIGAWEIRCLIRARR